MISIRICKMTGNAAQPVVDATEVLLVREVKYSEGAMTPSHTSTVTSAASPDGFNHVRSA
ncbi:hypothetical protein WKW79_18615 [Variovorax robiniae]|uniref:Uncharacterized protein n=1 Tax=Variovorax robiniae TaxID=1836199 RepID=A0ABU8XAH7_9BURK